MNTAALRSSLARSRLSGFTLVELMIVLVVLGVMAGMAVISFRNDPVTQLEREQLRLQGLLNFAADEAVLQGALLGLAVDSHSYQLVLFDADNQAWQTQQGRYFSAYSLPESIALSIELDGDRLTRLEQQQIEDISKAVGVEQVVPVILFLASAEITPFILTLRHVLSDKPLRLISDGLSGIRAKNNEYAR